MSMSKRSSLALLTVVCISVTAGAFCLEYFVLSAPTENNASPPTLALLPSLVSSDRPAFVFDEPEVDLGVVKETVSHRFTYRNASSRPLTITDVRPSCNCAVSQPDRKVLQPEETGSITLEANISQKQPGATRLALFVEYEWGDRKLTATAAMRVVHQPDLYITPRYVILTATEENRTTTNITLIDYRKESLKILKATASSPAIEAKINASPSEYLPGWHHVIEVAYTDPPKETRHEFREQVFLETSDPKLPLLAIPVEVRRLERLRLAPQSVNLQLGHPAEVILRDSLGQKVIIAECDTAGLVEASFSKEEGSTTKISLALPREKVDASRYPATIWIRVSKPCERRLPIRVSLAPAKGS